MNLPATAAAVPRLVVLASSPSTNTALAALAADPSLPSFTVVVTDDQTAGRGRLGREWVAPAGTAIAVSVLVRAGDVPPGAAGRLPLVAGIAMVDAVAPVVAAVVGLKWPNDVLIGGRKVCGILAEVLPSGDVVIGAGVNVAMTAEQLPVPTATSLEIQGADPAGLTDRLLAGYLRTLIDGIRVLATDTAQVRGLAIERCLTLGRDVRIELPGGDVFAGRAVDLDEDGRLVVRTADGDLRAVAAGDVHHVR